jgi:hypothetical protein
MEMEINSRPISYMSADDLEEPRTPSYLMVGRRLMSVPEVTEPEVYYRTPYVGMAPPSHSQGEPNFSCERKFHTKFLPPKVLIDLTFP